MLFDIDKDDLVSWIYPEIFKKIKHKILGKGNQWVVSGLINVVIYSQAQRMLELGGTFEVIFYHRLRNFYYTLNKFWWLIWHNFFTFHKKTNLILFYDKGQKG